MRAWPGLEAAVSDGFAEMIGTANQFFAELARNNAKDWFEPRKAFYVDRIRKPAELMADLMAEDLSRLTGKDHAPKVFRIHRDVRFSKDKSPYNPHLHILWRPKSETAPAWFFGSAPDYLVFGTGVTGLSGDRLTAYRAFVDEDGDDLAQAIARAGAAAGATLADWGEPPLKRVPRPYAEDHPHAGLLRRRNLILTAPPAAGWSDRGLIPALHDTAAALLPVWRLLDARFD